jgi:beta-glucosidase
LSYLRNATSKPIVLVIISGRPRLLNGCAESADAVLEAYLPGPMGGQAIAEVLSGRVVPSGRLPFSYPKHHGAIPYPYHRKTSDMCTDPNNGFRYIPCEVNNILYSIFSVDWIAME